MFLASMFVACLGAEEEKRKQGPGIQSSMSTEDLLPLLLSLPRQFLLPARCPGWRKYKKWLFMAIAHRIDQHTFPSPPRMQARRARRILSSSEWTLFPGNLKKQRRNIRLKTVSSSSLRRYKYHLDLCSSSLFSGISRGERALKMLSNNITGFTCQMRGQVFLTKRKPQGEPKLIWGLSAAK